MGFLSKIWKGVKKVVKKIVKPIAKIFKPITKFFNKFGVIGQIGMMFLMPYAFGALSSFGGAALKSIGSWSQTLMKSANWGAKALGHGLNLVHKAGTMVSNVYSNVTSTIKGAVDRTGNFLKGRGFVKTPDIQINLPKSGEISMPEDLSKSLGEGMDYKTAIDKSLAEAGSFKVPEGGIGPKTGSLMERVTSQNLTPDKFEFPKITLDPTKGFDEITMKAATDASINLTTKLPAYNTFIPEELITTQTDKAFSFMGMPSEANYFTGINPSKTKGVVDWVKTQASNINPFNPDGTLRKKFAKFDAGEFAVDSINRAVQGGIVQGAQTAISESVAKELGYEQPEGATYYKMNIPNLMEMTANNYTVFDSVNLMQSQTGNAWMASNYANANSINSFIDSSDNYNSYMGQFGKSMYDSTT